MQAILSEHGYDFPTGRSMTAINQRNEIFDIIHPYVLSADDLVTVQQTNPGIKTLWLETFTNSLKDMLHNNLNINAKHEFAGNVFPPRGALPEAITGRLIYRPGSEPGALPTPPPDRTASLVPTLCHWYEVPAPAAHTLGFGSLGLHCQFRLPGTEPNIYPLNKPSPSLHHSTQPPLLHEREHLI